MSTIREGYSPKIKGAAWPPDKATIERRPDGTVVGCPKCKPVAWGWEDELFQPGPYTSRHETVIGGPCSIHRP